MGNCRQRRQRSVIAVVLLMALILAGVVPGEGLAVKKTTLKTKKITIETGKKKKILLNGKKAKHKYTYTSKNKKVARVSKKGVVTGVKQGETIVTVKDTYKYNGKKKTKKVGRVKIMVTGKYAPKDDIAAGTAAPGTKEPEGTPSVPQNSQMPSASSAVTDTSKPADTSEPVATPETFDTPDKFDMEVDNVKYGEMTTISYYSTTTNKDRKANILLPPDYSEQKQYPVLYLLHGVGGDHNEWKGANPTQLIGNLIAEGRAEEMIVVMPNVRARENDGSPSDMLSLSNFQAFDNFINDLRDNLMPYIKENYSIAEGRENTAIAGLSMGGRESLYIGISMADTFGYIGAFSPAVGVLPYTGAVSEPGLFTKDTFKLADEYNGKTFVMICNGDKDGVVYDTPGEYHRVLEENGTIHTYYITSGGHDFKVWKNGLYNFARRIFGK